MGQLMIVLCSEPGLNETAHSKLGDWVAGCEDRDRVLSASPSSVLRPSVVGMM